MKCYDIAVIGGGIVGLTVALELKRRHGRASVAVFEKEASLGRHASGRNSGVLHAGIYYGTDTLKAKVCSSGSRMMQEYAVERGIRMKKTGKVIVASRPETAPQIDVLHRRALANGLRVERLDEKALSEIEPRARSFGPALFSPDTAVIDPKAVLVELKRDLDASGVAVFFNACVGDIRPAERSFKAGGDTFGYGHLINCAGAHADRIAHCFGVRRDLTIAPFKGRYFRLSREKNSWVRGNIYPAPDLRYPFLGVHLTRTADDEVYLGPTAMPALGRENYQGLEGMDPAESLVIFSRLSRMYLHNEDNFRGLVHAEIRKYRRKAFLNELRAMVPGLEMRDLVRCDKVGIRPQLVNAKTLKFEMDFILEKAGNSTHVLNAISPAFTGAFAFAPLVVQGIL